MQLRCSRCGKSIDWWKTTIEIIHQNFMLSFPFGLVGAKTTMFEFELAPNQSDYIDYCDYGVPRSARILAINYTPIGNLIPQHEHAQTLIDGRDTWKFEPHKYRINAKLLGKGEPKITKIGCMITWVERPLDDASLENLIEAFACYGRSKYDDCVVPANVAIEARLARSMVSYIQRFVGRPKASEFLIDGATYGHQLNVLLPIFSKIVGLAELPEDIRGALNRLRKLRNQIAHAGKLEKKLGKQDISKLLAAAVFGYAYIDLFQKEIDKIGAA